MGVLTTVVGIAVCAVPVVLFLIVPLLTSSWPTAQGELIDADRVHTVGSNGKSLSGYAISYTVNGQNFIKRAYVEQITEVGNTIVSRKAVIPALLEVRYDPTNPIRCSYAHEVSVSAQIWVSLICLIFGLGMIVVP